MSERILRNEDGRNEDGRDEDGRNEEGYDADLLVIGGGINGAAIARDAAGRGLSVILAEKDDLAGHTSSASTKLIHGGLRYLEQGAFRLVRESLAERGTWLATAPHLVSPLAFILPHRPGMRPVWMIRAGLALYDRLGGARHVPPARALHFKRHPQLAEGLAAGFSRGFRYWDCWGDDARLVIACARDAAAQGARIHSRSRVAALAREGAAGWRVDLAATGPGGLDARLRVRAVVNAAGAWVADLLNRAGIPSRSQLVLVKGSHLVLPRLFAGDHAYLLQAADGRVVFTIPYEGRFTLIGTTDSPFSGDRDRVACSEEESRYLLATVNRFLSRPATADAVLWRYSGLRALHGGEMGHAADSGAATRISRDYALELECGAGPEAPGTAAPLLSVFGGKLTTARALAEQAVNRLAPRLGVEAGPWTATRPLPGGAMTGGDFETFWRALSRRLDWMPETLRRRLARAYGSEIDRVLGGAQSMADLGMRVAGDLTEAELAHLRRAEWARTAEDVLWRRSKLGLHLSAAERARVAAWIDQTPEGDHDPHPRARVQTRP